MPIMLKADSSSPNKLFSIISGLAEPLSESHEPTRAESQKSKLCHRLAGHSCGYDTLDEQKFMTPVQEMSTMLPHNSLLESDTNNTTMIPEEVAEVLLDEKAVPSVVKEQDDWTSLGEISLNPDSHASPKDEETPVENKLELVDPWTQVDVTTKSPEEETVKASFVERWTSFRNRWNSNPLEDEQATAVIKEEATPPSPEISSLSPQTQSQLQSEEATPTRKGFSFFKSKSTPTVDPTNLSAQEMASFRASKISVTVQKESRDSKWGFGMDQKGSRVQIKVMTGTGLLEHAPFQVGDYLVSVNNQKCTRAETTIQELVKIDAEFPITLMVETPEGNPNLVQAMVRKPSPNANLGVGFYIPSEVVEPKQGESEPIVNPESPVTSELTEDKENETAAVIAPASDDPANKLLRINNIDPHGLLSHSALSQGDIVLAINATPCSQMTPAEAEVLLHQSDNSVTIIAMKPPSQTSTRTQGWLRHAKRAGVAIGGGTVSRKAW